MIYIGNIRDVRPGQFDKSYAIVRSWKGDKDGWLQQLSALAPSWKLFTQQQQLVANDEWTKEAFDSFYVPRFLGEMHQMEARRALNKLVIADRAGENIALCCYCTGEDMCHRKIVAGLLQGVGCNVQVPSRRDYTAYWKMYTSATQTPFDRATSFCAQQ